MIHSCPQTPDEISKTDALNGLWNTFVSYDDNKEVTMLCSRSRKVNTLVVPKVVNNAVAAFEKSAKNYERSVSVIYRGGILSKRKYNGLRSSEMFEFDLPTGKRRRTEFKKGCKVPSLVSYKDLMKFISQQEIGTLHNIPQARADSEIEKENEDVNQNLLPLVPGHFIDLEERLLQMADLYLHIDSDRPNFLNWFGKEKGNFLVAIGADGAPFGKCNEACSWLVSFLNVTERVSSPYDNFLICGGNCVKDHPSMIEYGKLLRSQISDLEKKTFTVKGLQVNFTVKRVPSDMKWLSKFSGELSNAATYPNPFANVNQKDLSERGCTLGNGPRDKWKPWAYDFRMQVANKVAQFKQKQPKLTNASQMQTLRNKVCHFIGNLKSRQEYEPILGPLVQNAKADSLHLGNNCWGHWFKKVLTTILANAKVGTNVKSVFQLPEDNPLRKHLKTLRFKLKCKKLYNKFCRWFKEKRKSGDFEFRFTGEETKKFCHGFMFIILIGDGSDIEQPKNFFALSMARMGLHLRNALSLAVRVSDIKTEDLPKLKEDCRMYFNLASLCHSTNVSVWTMGHCVPFHSNQLLEDLGVGLGINSMQGREAKHQQLAYFAEFPLVKNKWEKVFRHEHMLLIWLRQQNPFSDSYSKCKDKYIPPRCYSDEYCFCGIALDSEGKCRYCDSRLSKEIAISAASGSPTVKMKEILRHAEQARQWSAL